MHGGAWTSHRDAEVALEIEDPEEVSGYRFGTGTADFQVCSICGVVPIVLSEIDDHLYAVVNVNCFGESKGFTFSSASTDFDDEETSSRLERRKKNWIPSVTKTHAGNAAGTAVETDVLSTRHVLAVRDLAGATDFFHTTLGFEHEFSVDGWAFMSFGDFRLLLGECPDEVPAVATNNHSYFAHVLVDDADALFAQFRSNGASFSAEIDDKPWGLREFGVVTPEGHRIVFAEEIQSD